MANNGMNQSQEYVQGYIVRPVRVETGIQDFKTLTFDLEYDLINGIALFLRTQNLRNRLDFGLQVPEGQPYIKPLPHQFYEYTRTATDPFVPVYIPTGERISAIFSLYDGEDPQEPGHFEIVFRALKMK